MDTALVRPQLPTYSAITPESRAPEKTESVTKTELPVQKTVSPSSNSETSSRASDNPRFQEPANQQVNIERQNFIDPESESLIYQAKDKDSGEVVQQIPSESLRRVRVYTKAIADQTTSTFGSRTATTA